MSDLIASTQYNDLRGSVAVDFPGDLGTTEFKNYVESLGIDLNRYDPQGFEFYRGEDAEINEVYVSILAIDNTIKEEYKAKNAGKLPMVKIRKADTFLNLMTQVHRFNVIALKGREGDSNDPANLDLVGELEYKEIVE